MATKQIQGSIQAPDGSQYVTMTDGAGNLVGGGGAGGGTEVEGTVASGVTDAGNPVKIGGVYNTTVPTFTNGQRGDLQIGTRGSLSVQLITPNSSAVNGTVSTGGDGFTNAFNAYINAAFPWVFNGTTWDRLRGDSTAGAYVQLRAATTGGYSYSNITTNATTTVKSGAGTLHSIVVNTSGATDTITVYDSTTGSGTKIGTINSAATPGATLIYDVAFATGLTLVTAGTTPPDITVTYK